MRKLLAMALVMCLTYGVAGGSTRAFAAPQSQDDSYQAYAPDQLDNLLAPVALYPDPLLAQVLIASTFPDQIQDAAVFVRRFGNNIYGLDDQSWDVSVKAVSHYPTVLFMMNDQLDWTTALGQAYIDQPEDTMASVQHLRQLARTEGNLVSTPQQQVIDDRGYIEIVPAQPQYIFVPTYDAGVIYSRRVYTAGGFGGFFSFGSGFAIGAWLNYDPDWGSRRVVYNGWQAGGWRDRSRPYVQVNNVYVNNRYQNVTVNRTVVNRTVNYTNVNHFNSVHHDVVFDNHARPNARPGNAPGNGPDRNARGVQPSQPSQTSRPADTFNRGRGQDQATPAVQQHSPQASPQVEKNRGAFNQGAPNQAPSAAQPPQPSNPNQGFNRGRGQDQAAPPAQQQSPQASPQVERNRGAFNQGAPNQAPPAARPTPQPDNNRGGGFRGRGQDQGAAAAPPQPSAQPPQRNDNPGRNRQDQAPPARVEQPAPRPAPASRPAPPAQAQQERGNQPQGRGDRGNEGRNNDNKDRRDH